MKTYKDTKVKEDQELESMVEVLIGKRLLISQLGLLNMDQDSEEDRLKLKLYFQKLESILRDRKRCE